MRLPAFSILFLLFAACDSPDDAFRKLAVEFAEDYENLKSVNFIIRTESIETVLPMPPGEESKKQLQALGARYGRRLAQIDTAQLSPERRSQFSVLEKRLRQFAADGQDRSADFAGQASAIFAERLGGFAGQDFVEKSPDEVAVFLEKMGEYLGGLHQNWRPKSGKKLEAAVGNTLKSLEYLAKMEEKAAALPEKKRQRLETALVSGRLAMKDFIAICQSAVLN